MLRVFLQSTVALEKKPTLVPKEQTMLDHQLQLFAMRYHLKYLCVLFFPIS